MRRGVARRDRPGSSWIVLVTHFGRASPDIYYGQRLQENQACSASRKLPCQSPARRCRGAQSDPHGAAHFVNHRALKGPYPEGFEKAMFGLGCFWGAERKFWELGDGIHVTAVGYAGGMTPNPTYEEVCSGRTGHNEVVLVVYDPKKISYEHAAQDFLGKSRPDAGHAPGQRRRHPVPLRHLHFNAAQRQAAEASKAMYEQELKKKRYGAITTEIIDAPEFYFAEDYHQQYLAKNPAGYCGLGGTGVSCPIGTGAKLTQGAPA